MLGDRLFNPRPQTESREKELQRKIRYYDKNQRELIAKGKVYARKHRAEIKQYNHDYYLLKKEMKGGV